MAKDKKKQQDEAEGEGGAKAADTAVRVAARKGHLRLVIRQRQMIVRTRKKRTIRLAVVGDAAGRDAAEIHAVIGALTSNQPKAAALPALLGIGARDLECCVRRFRSRIDEEDVIQAFGRQSGNSLRQFEGSGMAELERRREVEFARGLANGVDNLFAAMTCVDAPESRTGVEQRAPAFVVEVHAFGTRQ